MHSQNAGMTFSSKFIDEIVQNVMRELNLPQTPAAAAPASPASAAPASHLTDRVITEDVLASHAAAGSTVVVAPGAVITPSGRDYIRRHSLLISTAASASPSDTGLILTVGDSAGVAAAAKSAGWQIENVCSNHEAARQMKGRGADCRTVCCTAQPSVVACLINRCSDRRVAVLTSDTCVTELLAEMNPDTVCLSASGWSFGRLTRLLRQLSSHEVAAPTSWKELA